MHGIMYIGEKRNSKVRKHNLRGTENEMSGWQLAPLREKRMNRLVHDY